MLAVVLVVSLIFYAIVTLVFKKLSCYTVSEAQRVEAVWTIAPAVVLVILAIPSLRLLYQIDAISNPSLTVKAIGHQWYWRYEYNDFFDLEFNSYIVPTNDLVGGGYRLLEVDNRIVVPLGLETRMVVTSSDVIHSWTVPSFGVKIDAVPGRLNQVSFTPNRPGVFYGQCSEICGSNHSFMPVSVEVVDLSTFVKWGMRFIG